MSSAAPSKRKGKGATRVKGAMSQEALTERLRFLTGSSVTPQHQADDIEYPDESVGEHIRSQTPVVQKTPPKPLATFRAVHLVVILVCLSIAIGYSIFTAVNGRTQVIVEEPEEIITVSTPSPTPVELFRVHVIGAVAKPGVVDVPKGSRVIDAIEAAGGFTTDAVSGDLNLAAVLSDGSQIVIGGSNGVSSELRALLMESSSGSGGKIDLNRATASQLETLPGIGSVMAGRIIERRTQRPFSRVEELQEITGIGPKIYAKLADLVQV